MSAAMFRSNSKEYILASWPLCIQNGENAATATRVAGTTGKILFSSFRKSKKAAVEKITDNKRIQKIAWLASSQKCSKMKYNGGFCSMTLVR